MRLFALLSFVCPTLIFSFTVPSNVGAYVVLDAQTGEVLAEHAKDEPLYPASCTKVASLVYMLSSTPDLDLQTKVVVPKQAITKVVPGTKAKGDWTNTPSYLLETDGSSAGFVTGEIVTLRDLLYGMMLPSGNDAANTLAYYWGNRSIDSFVTQLNGFVQNLGLTHTHLTNPHGLHHPDHVMSAYDLALVTKKGLDIPLFREIVKTPTYTRPKTNKHKDPAVWKNSNKLLRKGPYFLADAIGMKTGHTQKAGFCLVAAGENNGRTIIVAILKHPDNFQLCRLARTMLEEYLNEQPVEKELVSQGTLKLAFQAPGHSEAVPVRALEAPFTVRYYPSEKPEFEAKAVWHSKFPPLSEKDEVGVLELYRNKKMIASIPLAPSHSIAPTFQTRLSQLQHYLKKHKALAAALAMGCFLFVGVVFVVLFRKKKR